MSFKKQKDADENDSDDIVIIDEDSENEGVDTETQSASEREPVSNGPTEKNGSELATLKAELAEEKKRYLYLRADFENYRRQVVKERSELVKFGSEPILREFLNVLDNLERAAHASLTPETMETYKNGLELILSSFKKTFERFGVEEVSCLNQPFDPNQHEALSSESNPDLPNNVISQVFKKAYKLHGKLIRPAQVVVNTVKDEAQS